MALGNRAELLQQAIDALDVRRGEAAVAAAEIAGVELPAGLILPVNSPLLSGE